MPRRHLKIPPALHVTCRAIHNSSSAVLTNQKRGHNLDGPWENHDGTSSDQRLYGYWKRRSCDLHVHDGTKEQSDYYEDISSDEEHHEKVEKKETNVEANVEAAVVPGPSEMPSDSELMMDVVPSTSREGAPVTEKSNQEGRTDDGNDKRANDDRRVNADPVTVVSTVNVRMQRRTVVYPNGFFDIMRTTDFTFSEDIDPANVNYNELLRDIMSEVPLHFANMDRPPSDDQ